MKIFKNFDLTNYNSWKISAMAENLVRPGSRDELLEVAEFLSSQPKFQILGGGTNVLISSGKIEGLTVLLDQWDAIETENSNEDSIELVCQSGVRKSDILKSFIKSKRAPALFLAGLPGDVGGGVVMNAGVSHLDGPKDFSDITDWVEYISLSSKEPKFIKKNAKELIWNYRKCTGWQPGLITRVGLKWVGSEQPALLKQLQASNKRRMSTQPLSMPSCGSVFRNPQNDKAGRLIESCNLKGFSVGGAEVSQIHANFIINKSDATSEDIKNVISHVQKVVQEKTGILLEKECVYFG